MSIDLTFSAPAPLPTMGAVTPDTAPTETPEVATPEAPKEPTPEERIKSSQFAALAKKERMIQQRAQANKAKEAELAAIESKIKERESAFNEMNPIKAMEKLGYSYEDITKFMLDDQKNLEPVMQVKRLQSEMDKRFQEQQKMLEDRDNAEKARIQAEYEQTITGFKTDVKEFVKGNGEKFELTNLLNQDELVIATIEQYFETNKKILPTEQAAEHVENYLRDQVKKIQDTKWYKSMNAPQVPEVKKPTAQTQTPKPPSPTLSNVSQSVMQTYTGPKTEKDRMARAIAALSGSGT
jgi:hypothetical protein